MAADSNRNEYSDDLACAETLRYAADGVMRSDEICRYTGTSVGFRPASLGGLPTMSRTVSSVGTVARCRNLVGQTVSEMGFLNCWMRPIHWSMAVRGREVEGVSTYCAGHDGLCVLVSASACGLLLGRREG